MKKQSLSIQIWSWFIIIIIAFSVCLSGIFYVALEKYFEEQIYAQIESQQISEISITDVTPDEEYLSNFIITEPVEMEDGETITAIPLEITNTIVTPNSGSDIIVEQPFGSNATLDPNLTTEIIKLGDAQQLDIQRYTKVVDGEKEMSVIFKKSIEGQPYYLYSSARENFKHLILSQFWVVFAAILVLSILLLLPAKIIAKKISRPLATLEKDMHRIASRDWKTSIAIEGPLEIMNLSSSCETMRKELIQHDQNQQFLMQSISHELKTPIMVIRNYLQAIKDGYYPKGTLENTLDTMDIEAKRLQKKTKDLISITNIDYMARQNLPTNPILLEALILEVYDLLKYERNDVKWHFKMNKEMVQGHYELWKIVLENLLQNQLRYSKSIIAIKVESDEDSTRISVSNDGPHFDDKQLEKIFTAFSKGENGQNGLGLYIVKRIINMYQGDVYANNKELGVEFLILIPNN
jgi:two-component system sensor histidine kinase CssS